MRYAPLDRKRRFFKALDCVHWRAFQVSLRQMFRNISCEPCTIFTTQQVGEVYGDVVTASGL